MLKLLELPRKSQIKKTSSGYSYKESVSNVTCNFKGTEPSPKGFGLCARMVLEGEHAKGTDGNIWVKKGGRWLKDKPNVLSKKVVKVFHAASAKSNNKSKVKKHKKQTGSNALKIHNEVYKVWNKVAKKSKKRYGSEDYLIAHPDGLGTDQKYLDWEECVSKDLPKRECNKIITMLKKDLSKMNKALEKVNKPVKPKVNKTLKKVGKNNLYKYSSIAEWRKISPLGKKFNKMVLKANKGSKWDYKLAEQYNLEENKMEKKFDKPVKVKKLGKSKALKIHDEIYKVWDKVSKKSMKLHGFKEYFIPNPQFHNISKAKSFKHNIKTTDDNGFSLYCDCGLNTGDKYLYYESCISKSRPKKECNKYITMLNKDLTNVQKALELSKKQIVKKSKVKAKKTPVKVKAKKAKKQTKSEALKIHNEVYKVWDKVAKKSKKIYGDEEHIIHHPDGLAWGYGTYQKYLDYENCLAKSKPKRECNKLVTMLKKDLIKMNKALDKVNKKSKSK